MADIDLDSVPPCPVCGGTLTEHDAREPESLEGWWGHYDCACGWVLHDQQQRLTYWTAGGWTRALAQEVARLRAERDEARAQGAHEERAAVVAWLREVAPGAYGGPIPGTTSDLDPDLDREHAAAAIAGGEHRKRTRPTEPPPVVVVRREVGDE